MTGSAKNPKVEFFFDKQGPWHDAYARLRVMALDSGLTEELKWGCPCYTLDGRNVFLIHGFKDYCALLFMKGALIKDEAGVLIQQTENVQSARQMRFTGVDDIVRRENIIKSCIADAIDIEKSGRKVTLKKTADFNVPEEFQVRLDQDPGLKAAFESLTQGRQRGYMLHFSSAKQSATRAARVEKCIPRILEGKGLDD
ncbi:MAG: YdeI/OmpD-associated family protein [Asticcacaulis sp.]